MTSQIGVLGAEWYLILSCNYHSPLLLKVLSDKQALVDEVIQTLVTISLKSIRYLIGSQCSECSSGVMWQNLDSLKIKRAAAFCTLCSLAS